MSTCTYEYVGRVGDRLDRLIREALIRHKMLRFWGGGLT